MAYTSKDSDALDKLTLYPLLIHWPFPSKSDDDEGTNQLSLEISTSLATLGLSDVDYNKSVARLVRGSTGAGETHDEKEEEVEDTSKKDPLFGSGLQKYPTVPGELAGGECVSEVVGVIDER